MIFSHSVEENKFTSFALFLNQLLDGQSKYKSEIDDVLSEVIALAKGTKTLFQVDRDKLPIILYLKNSDPEFFSDIDIQEITNDVYKKTLSSIEDKKSEYNV